MAFKAWYKEDPHHKTVLVTTFVAGLALLYSSYHITKDANHYGVPFLFSLTMIALLDGFQIVSYLIIITNAKRNQTSPWQWQAIGVAATLGLVINVDEALRENHDRIFPKTGMVLPQLVFTIIWASIAPIVFFLLLKYLASEYLRIAAERDKPVKERAYRYWLQRIENGHRVTANQLGKKFQIAPRTAGYWLKAWREDRTNSVMIPANGYNLESNDEEE